jgi:hypothetical protein
MARADADVNGLVSVASAVQQRLWLLAPPLRVDPLVHNALERRRAFFF